MVKAIQGRVHNIKVVRATTRLRLAAVRGKGSQLVSARARLAGLLIIAERARLAGQL